MAEDDLDMASIPTDTTPYLPATLENGDSQSASELAEKAKSEAGEAGEAGDEEEKTPAKPSPRVKAKTPSKAKPSKTLLQFSKKKRKHLNSEGSDHDLDATPPPSPPDEESGVEKRRSGRNTGIKRKKYVDDVQMTFSDHEDMKDLPKDVSGVASQAMLNDLLGPITNPNAENAEAEGDLAVPSGQAGPNYAFIDPTAEDTMIVQYILTSRTGSRELEDSEVSLDGRYLEHLLQL